VIEIRTFFRKDLSFVLSEDWSTTFDDCDYIEGGLELSIDGVPLITLEMWDYIDQLWEYIVDLFDRALATGSSAVFFPDQPIELTLQYVPRPGLFIVGVSRTARKVVATADSADIVAAICGAGDRFFRLMMKLAPVNDASYAEVLKRIDRIRNLT